jgi:hypothetical protein
MKIGTVGKSNEDGPYMEAGNDPTLKAVWPDIFKGNLVFGGDASANWGSITDWVTKALNTADHWVSDIDDIKKKLQDLVGSTGV